MGAIPLLCALKAGLEYEKNKTPQDLNYNISQIIKFRYHTESLTKYSQNMPNTNCKSQRKTLLKKN
jgi:hypothetical protein